MEGRDPEARTSSCRRGGIYFSSNFPVTHTNFFSYSKAIEYINDLLSERNALLSRLTRARSALPPAHPALVPGARCYTLAPPPKSTNEDGGGGGKTTVGPPTPVLIWEREWTGGDGRNGDDDEDDEEE